MFAGGAILTMQPMNIAMQPFNTADVADAEKLKAAGAEVVVCVAVNDAFAVSRVELTSWVCRQSMSGAGVRGASERSMRCTNPRAIRFHKHGSLVLLCFSAPTCRWTPGARPTTRRARCGACSC